MAANRHAAPTASEVLGAQRTRDLILICAAMGTTFVAQTMLLLVVPLHALSLGATPALIGALVSAPFIVPSIFAIPMGQLVVRVGARRLMTIGAIGTSVGPLVALATGSFAGLFAMMVVFGTMQIAMGISAQSTVAGLGRGTALERAFGWYSTTVSVGQMLGPIAGGVLLDLVGAQGVFAVAAILPLIAGACVRGLRGTAPGHRMAGPLSFGYRPQGQLLRHHAAVQLAVVVTVAVLFGFGAHAAFFPVYLESLAVPATVIGALVSLRALASTAVRPFMVGAIRLLGGRSRTVLVSVSVMAVAMAATGLTTVVPLLAALALALGIGAGLAQPLTMVAIADHVGGDRRPAALGLRLTSNQAAQVVGPLTLGLIAEWAGLPAMFVAAGCFLVLCIAMLRRIAPGYEALERERAAGVAREAA